MKKNEILNKLIESLTNQRKELIEKIANVNHNENSYSTQVMTLENSVNNIDIQLGLRVLDLEIDTK